MPSMPRWPSPSVTGMRNRQLRLLSGLSMYFNRLVDVAGSLEVALRGEAAAKKTGNPDDAAIADSMLGQAYYLLGEHHQAQKHLERALYGSAPLRRVNASQYPCSICGAGGFSFLLVHTGVPAISIGPFVMRQWPSRRQNIQSRYAARWL